MRTFAGFWTLNERCTPSKVNRTDRLDLLLVLLELRRRDCLDLFARSLCKEVSSERCDSVCTYRRVFHSLTSWSVSYWMENATVTAYLALRH